MVDLVARRDLLQHRRRGLGIRQVDLPGLGGEWVRRAAARKVDNVVAVAMQALGDAASDAPARAGDEGDGSGHDLPWRRLMSRSEEQTSELQSLMRISYAVFCLKKKKKH